MRKRLRGEKSINHPPKPKILNSTTNQNQHKNSFHNPNHTNTKSKPNFKFWISVKIPLRYDKKEEIKYQRTATKSPKWLILLLEFLIFTYLFFYSSLIYLAWHLTITPLMTFYSLLQRPVLKRVPKRLFGFAFMIIVVLIWIWVGTEVISSFNLIFLSFWPDSLRVIFKLWSFFELMVFSLKKNRLWLTFGPLKIDGLIFC